MADFASPSSGGALPAFLNDPSIINSLSGIAADSLDYLKIDDAVIAQANQQVKSGLPARGFTDDLCYGTGCTYLAALSLGTMKDIEVYSADDS
jgi:import inner membrane translocase subunit TIM23